MSCCKFHLAAGRQWTLWAPYDIEAKGTWRTNDTGKRGTFHQIAKTSRLFYADIGFWFDIPSGAGKVSIAGDFRPHGPIPVVAAHCTAMFTVH